MKNISSQDLCLMIKFQDFQKIMASYFYIQELYNILYGHILFSKRNNFSDYFKEKKVNNLSNHRSLKKICKNEANKMSAISPISD